MSVESRAIGLYAVGARDIIDFMDMVEESSVETLALLQSMLTTPNDSPDHDQELNDLLSPIVKRALEGKS